MTGAEQICSFLEQTGVDVVFGLPGTQNVFLFEALRKSNLKTIVTSDEMAAGFMANGYYRASGNLGVFCTIPGPGLTYALTPLAEALADSAAVLFITLTHSGRGNGRRFELQALDQEALLRPVTKKYFRLERREDLEATFKAAYREALAGEPGPVAIEINHAILAERLKVPAILAPELVVSDVQSAEVEQARTMIANAKKPLLFCGQGASDTAEEVRAFAEMLYAPVMTTCSGRGVVADDWPLTLRKDFSFGLGAVAPKIFSEADLIVALGCKFTHNGTGGFGLSIPKEKLIHVDTSVDNLNGPYPAVLPICADVKRLLSALMQEELKRSQWREEDIFAFQQELEKEQQTAMRYQPLLASETGAAPLATFFSDVAQLSSEETVLTTDSGLHQGLVRAYGNVREPRSLLCPSDFQSMGFGIPAAIGAKCACPEKRVIALVGDGGFLQTATELLTAVREEISLVVVVFNDGSFGLIRQQQIEKFGRDYGTRLRNPEMASFVESMGCRYLRYESGRAEDLADAIAYSGVTVIELCLSDSPTFKQMAKTSRVREQIHGVPGVAGLWRAMKRLLRR